MALNYCIPTFYSIDLFLSMLANVVVGLGGGGFFGMWGLDTHTAEKTGCHLDISALYTRFLLIFHLED